MTEADLPSANELRRLAGWNQTGEDFRRLLRLAPGGCFVSAVSGTVVGTVTTTTYGQALAWIGMMLVHPEHRRKGIATRLMIRALEHLREHEIACIQLDATPAGRPLYEQLGFVEESDLTRWRREPPERGGENVLTHFPTREVQDADWPAIDRIDTAAFGVQRGKLLRDFARASIKGLVWPDQGRVQAWGLLRAGAHSDYLGPLEGPWDGLTALVTTLLAHASPRPMLWDIPDEQLSATDLARRLDFKPLRPLTRMRLGPAREVSGYQTLFGIVDPAVG